MDKLLKNLKAVDWEHLHDHEEVHEYIEAVAQHSVSSHSLDVETALMNLSVALSGFYDAVVCGMVFSEAEEVRDAIIKLEDAL